MSEVYITKFRSVTKTTNDRTKSYLQKDDGVSMTTINMFCNERERVITHSQQQPQQDDADSGVIVQGAVDDNEGNHQVDDISDDSSSDDGSRITVDGIIANGNDVVIIHDESLQLSH